MSWKELGTAMNRPCEAKKTMSLGYVIALMTIAVLLMFGVFVLKSSYENPTIVPEPELTFEESMAITDEYIQRLKERNDSLRELIELQKLQIELINGKAHSA